MRNVKNAFIILILLNFLKNLKLTNVYKKEGGVIGSSVDSCSIGLVQALALEKIVQFLKETKTMKRCTITCYFNSL